MVLYRNIVRNVEQFNLNISFFYIKMNQVVIEKEYCPTCNRVIAKNRVNSSSIEIRRLIHNINTFEGIIANKDRLYKFVRSQYRVKDFADQFLKDLEEKLDNGNRDEDELVSIKLWLIGFVNDVSGLTTPREMVLYKFLSETYSSIDIPFSEFYDIFCHNSVDSMSKNLVSRALSAFGLKGVMKKIPIEGRIKSTIMLCATEEEMTILREKNGLGEIIPIP